MKEDIVQFPSKENESEVYPLTDACRSILEEGLEDGERLPQETEEALLDLQDLEENSPADSLGFAFTLLIEGGIGDPETGLIKKGILEETETT